MKKPVLFFLVMAGASAAALIAGIPQATVTAPNGGENLLLGTEYTITWNCNNCAGNVNVIVEIFNTLHSGPGYHGQVSPAGVPMNQGYFKWLVVGKLKDGTFVKPGPGYKVHLEAIDGSDASDGTFSIAIAPFPRIIVTQLKLSRRPDCPECVRIELKPLLDNFKDCRNVFRIALFANDQEVVSLGDFGGGKRADQFANARLSLPLQGQAQNRRGRFELRLFNAQAQLLQTQAVQLIL